MKLYVIVLLAILGAAAAYSSQFNGQQIANKVRDLKTDRVHSVIFILRENIAAVYQDRTKPLQETFFGGCCIAQVTSTSTTSMKLFDWKRRGETPLLAGGPRGFSLACTIYVFFYLFLFTLFHLFEQHSVLHIYTLSNTL